MLQAIIKKNPMGTIANGRVAIIYELLTILYETLIFILALILGTLFNLKIIVTSIRLSFILLS